MKYKKIHTFINLIFFTIILCFFCISCEDSSPSNSISGNSENKSGSAIENAVVDLPSCISNENSQKNIRSTESDFQEVKSLFEPIRNTIGQIDLVSKELVTIISNFEEAIAAQESGEWIAEDGSLKAAW